jgi:tRNA 2-thiouridine synthesizing protein A
MEVKKTVDTQGMFCPVPILELAKAIRELGELEVVVLLATDPAVREDLKAYCAATGHALLSFESVGTLFRGEIQKKGVSQALSWSTR